MNGCIKMPVYLWDTNILIYYFNGNMDNGVRKKVTTLMQASFQVSIISKMEFLGFPFGDENKQNALDFIGYADVIPLTDEIVARVIDIRQSKKIKLPDTIITATAMALSATLITRNTKDFKNLKMDIFNPFLDANED